jgi:hypothetical protein
VDKILDSKRMRLQCTKEFRNRQLINETRSCIFKVDDCGSGDTYVEAHTASDELHTEYLA